MTYLAIDDSTLRRERNIRAASGALLGALLLAVALFAAWAHYEQPQRIVDRRMERACGWPKIEGEFLWVRVHKGKIECGRYR